MTPHTTHRAHAAGERTLDVPMRKLYLEACGAIAALHRTEAHTLSAFGATVLALGVDARRELCIGDRQRKSMTTLQTLVVQ